MANNDGNLTLEEMFPSERSFFTNRETNMTSVFLMYDARLNAMQAENDKQWLQMSQKNAAQVASLQNEMKVGMQEITAQLFAVDEGIKLRIDNMQESKSSADDEVNALKETCMEIRTELTRKVSAMAKQVQEKEDILELKLQSMQGRLDYIPKLMIKTSAVERDITVQKQTVTDMQFGMEMLIKSLEGDEEEEEENVVESSVDEESSDSIKRKNEMSADSQDQTTPLQSKVEMPPPSTTQEREAPSQELVQRVEPAVNIESVAVDAVNGKEAFDTADKENTTIKTELTRDTLVETVQCPKGVARRPSMVEVFENTDVGLFIEGSDKFVGYEVIVPSKERPPNSRNNKPTRAERRKNIQAPVQAPTQAPIQAPPIKPIGKNAAPPTIKLDDTLIRKRARKRWNWAYQRVLTLQRLKVHIIPFLLHNE